MGLLMGIVSEVDVSWVHFSEKRLIQVKKFETALVTGKKRFKNKVKWKERSSLAWSLEFQMKGQIMISNTQNLTYKGCCSMICPFKN